MSTIIEMRGISKSFGPVAALSNVDFRLEPGSIHALMGENGAGKSTLMKILAGVLRPTSGEILLAGKPLSLSSPRDGLDAGISVVFQEQSLLANLTVAENMFLGREPRTRWGGIDYPTMRAKTREALAQLDLDFDPDRQVAELGIAERQFLEIAHGIHANARVMILDEPTAALNAADVDVLNRNIRRLASEGCAIVYVSHRLEEIFELCDTVTVLKDGALVGTRPVSEMNTASLIAMMVGRELSDMFPPRADETGAPMLGIEDMVLQPGAAALNLTVNAGEIVALAGLEGQGQSAIARALVGLHVPVSGHIHLKGQTVPLPLPRESGLLKMHAAGLGFVPEDRKEEGLLLNLSVAQNIALGRFAGVPAVAPASGTRAVVQRMMDAMNIKAAGPRARVGSLSGGNQQKVLFGRALAAEMDVLVIEEPTRGVDVGAKAEIYGLLRDFTAAGGAVLVLSREALELIGLADRIYVIHDNAIAGEIAATEATEHKLLDMALSGGKAENA
ncbi:sugar ABC transporter ATP-binding protein [Oceanibium sediminis]|uniref:sugar ABC transporter ATP-binding protein n=1 Tax=Oceanibium sediminis TaxID=2026339 RepID=UPI000DD2B875|nr:sugar ABC transporter ATP-binding protein [Oceanibium sediminis]